MATSTLGSGTLVLAGTTSGTTTVTATAVAGTTTLTLPAATDTLVGKATTDTLTNKTLTGAAMNGTLGATTPSTVAATSISASTTLGVTGVSTLTGGAVIEGMTVGKGAGAVATNTAVGASALAGSNSGTGDNVALGFEALKVNTTGSRNTAVGNTALKANTTGVGHVSVGHDSLSVNTTGSDSTAVGRSALSSNTTGSSNTGLGYFALAFNTTADRNTAVGYQAGYTNTTNIASTFVGYRAGYLSTGAQCTFVGDNAGQNSTGTLNGFFGQAAGYLVTSGAKNTIIGSYSGNQGGLDIRTASNYIVLSDGDGNPRGYFGGSGSIGDGCFIKTGTSSTSRILPATDNVGYIGENSYRWQAIYAVNGTIQTSDGREKNTIADSNLGLSFIQSLRPVSYKWNVGENVVTYDEEKNPIVTPRAGVRSHYGFIAQEVKAVIPEGVDFGGFVQEPDDGMMSLRYHEFIGPLVKAIQELKAEVDSLKAQINGASA